MEGRIEDSISVYPQWIKIVRLIARVLSIVIFLSVMGLEWNGHSIFTRSDSFPLFCLFFVGEIGLFIAWRYELIGSLVALAACFGLTANEPRLLMVPLMYIVYVNAGAFLLCWSASRSLPPVGEKVYPIVRIVWSRVKAYPKSTFLIVFGVIISVCYYYSDEEFLPFMRYREIKVVNTFVGYGTYFEEIEGGSFRVQGGLVKRHVRIHYIKWTGDTATAYWFFDGILLVNRETVRIEDSTIASLNEDILTPHKTGTTNLLVMYHDRIDSIKITVTHGPKHFVVE